MKIRVFTHMGIIEYSIKATNPTKYDINEYSHEIMERGR